MASAFSQRLKSFDWGLLTLIFLLVIFGLVIHYGLNLNTAVAGLSNFSKQLIFSLIGFLLIFVVSQLDFRLLKSLAYFLYAFTLILLALVLFFGQIFHGVRGWLPFGLFNFQVVELVKLTSIIALAAFWQKTIRPLPFSRIIVSLIFVVPAAILIFLQPDFGSAVILFLTWLGFIFVINKNKKHFIILFVILILAVVCAYFFFLKDYQRERLLTFFSPDRDPLGRGYQIRQSIVAIGSGKFFGRGLTFGPQSQLKFLPASQTDFIFAVIAEETGLVGCLIIFIIFALFLRRLNKIARRTYDAFGVLIVVGVLINFFIHFVLNIGMNLGLLPIVGIPLPFLSYGGSSLIVSLITVGLAESIVVHRVSGAAETEIKF